MLDALAANQSDEELRKIRRYFKGGDGEYGAGDEFMGVRMGTVFQIAKEHATLEPGEIEVLLDSPIHEARAAAVKVMAVQAAAKATAESRRTELYELYLRRHDRINNWDLVDLGAADVDRSVPVRAAPRPALRPGPLARPVAAAHGHLGHAALPAQRPGRRHVRHRGARPRRSS